MCVYIYIHTCAHLEKMPVVVVLTSRFQLIFSRKSTKLRVAQVAGDSTPEGNCFGDPEVPMGFGGFQRWGDRIIAVGGDEISFFCLSTCLYTYTVYIYIWYYLCVYIYIYIYLSIYIYTYIYIYRLLIGFSTVSSI